MKGVKMKMKTELKKISFPINLNESERVTWNEDYGQQKHYRIEWERINRSQE